MKEIKVERYLNHLADSYDPERGEEHKCDHVVPVIKPKKCLFNIVELCFEPLGTFFLVEHAMQLPHHVKLMQVLFVDFRQEKVPQNVGKWQDCDKSNSPDP